MRRKAGSVSLYLRLVMEDQSTIVGEDAAGDRRIFRRADLRSCIFSRKMEAVSIVIEREKLRHIKIEKNEASLSAEMPVVKVERRCLTCRHKFHAHPSTFICPPCKKTSIWHSGPDYSVAS